LGEGETGFCRARVNRGGRVVCENYGRLTALALDPIEKKPLARFLPGSLILSAGSYGCNLRCPFCQNHRISMAGAADVETAVFSPESLAEQAAALTPRGNIGLAYTYNEPLVGYEFVRDAAVAVRARGLKNVVVTNGCVQETYLRALLPLVDAMNIDLKGFTARYYRWLQGDLAAVQRAIELAAVSCHLEVTTLILPGENDDAAEMDALAAWLAGVDPCIPLHISRFHPDWKCTEKAPTPVETVYALADVARARLRYVYTGNC
jgi:pyruvate formate lyase activating enzyme